MGNSINAISTTEVARHGNEHYLHASSNQLPIGTVLSPRANYVEQWGSTAFYTALEKHRPKSMLAHHEAVFMCASAEDLDICIGGEWIFELNIPANNRIERHDLNWSSQVSCLVSDGASEEEVQAAAENYWNGIASDDPLWEYLTESATITQVHQYDDYEDKGQTHSSNALSM